MSSKLPEPTRLAYVRQLADEAKTLVPGVERLAEIVVELRTDDLYRLLGFDTWEQFCTGYLGISKWTANRLIAGPKPKSITAGQSVAAVHPAPIVESDPLKIPAASTEAPAKPSEGERGEAPAVNHMPPSGKSSEGVGKNGAGSLSHSAPGDSIARPGSPAPSDDLPSDRQLTARVFAAMREVDPTDAGPVTTPEEATFLRQWAQRTLDAWKAVFAPPAPAEKPQRRQGTITRPADRAPKPPVKVNGAPLNGSLTRREVTPMFKP